MSRGYHGVTRQSAKADFATTGDPAKHVAVYTMELPTVVGKHDGNAWFQTKDENFRKKFQLDPFINKPLNRATVAIQSDMDQNANPIAGTNRLRFIGKPGGFAIDSSDVRDQMLNDYVSQGNPLSPEYAAHLHAAGIRAAPGADDRFKERITSVKNGFYDGGSSDQVPERASQIQSAPPRGYNENFMPFKELFTRAVDEIKYPGLAQRRDYTGPDPANINGSSVGENLAPYHPAYSEFIHQTINAPKYASQPVDTRVNRFIKAKIRSYYDLLSRREAHARHINDLLKADAPISTKVQSQLKHLDATLDSYPSLEDMEHLQGHHHHQTPEYKDYMAILHEMPHFDFHHVHNILAGHSTELQRLHNIAFTQREVYAKEKEVEVMQPYNPYITRAGA
jgi:hypothetical protein